MMLDIRRAQDTPTPRNTRVVTRCCENGMGARKRRKTEKEEEEGGGGLVGKDIR